MGKRLAIIGASYLQLPLVLKAREMGLETLCFAWKEGAVRFVTSSSSRPASRFGCLSPLSANTTFAPCLTNANAVDTNV